MSPKKFFFVVCCCDANDKKSQNISLNAHFFCTKVVRGGHQSRKSASLAFNPSLHRQEINDLLRGKRQLLGVGVGVGVGGRRVAR